MGQRSILKVHNRDVPTAAVATCAMAAILNDAFLLIRLPNCLWDQLSSYVIFFMLNSTEHKII